MALTHYRKVYKSDHLGVEDLKGFLERGIPLIFTIREVKQELGAVIAGKKGDHNIAYFEPINGMVIKPMVLNATNGKILSKFADSVHVEKWSNITVQLYIEPNVKMKGEIVGGVRINKNKPKGKKILVPGIKEWARAVAAYTKTGSLDNVLKHMTISDSNKDKLISEASNAKTA